MVEYGDHRRPYLALYSGLREWAGVDSNHRLTDYECRYPDVVGIEDAAGRQPPQWIPARPAGRRRPQAGDAVAPAVGVATQARRAALAGHRAVALVPAPAVDGLAGERPVAVWTPRTRGPRARLLPRPRSTPLGGASNSGAGGRRLHGMAGAGRREKVDARASCDASWLPHRRVRTVVVSDGIAVGCSGRGRAHVGSRSRAVAGCRRSASTTGSLTWCSASTSAVMRSSLRGVIGSTRQLHQPLRLGAPARLRPGRRPLRRGTHDHHRRIVAPRTAGPLDRRRLDDRRILLLAGARKRGLRVGVLAEGRP